jgi:hypothetical protein
LVTLGAQRCVLSDKLLHERVCGWREVHRWRYLPRAGFTR